MFGISMWEMALIILVGLIFLGPRQLTETARAVGRLFREVQRMAVDVKDSIDFDAPPRRTTSHETPKTNPPAPSPANSELDSLKLTDQKSGPDFYAELLENSAEETPKTSGQKSELTSEVELKMSPGLAKEEEAVEKKPEKS